VVTRRLLAVVLALTVVWMVLAVWIVLGQGRWVAAGASSPARADVIVALGGGEGYRDSKVAQLFAAGHAPAVLVTGLEWSPESARSHYLNWRMQLLTDAGVPRERLLAVTAATNSFQEAEATLALMRARGWQTAWWSAIHRTCGGWTGCGAACLQVRDGITCWWPASRRGGMRIVGGATKRPGSSC
jgi:uncharacterized SAM-binding protein YcdF (DUF218 family)